MHSYFMKLYTEKHGRKICTELAEVLVKDLAVTDGSGRTSGERWTIDEAEEIGAKTSVSWDTHPLAEFYLVLNMMYSDFFRTAKKKGFASETSFFADLAYDWLNDEDGKPDKTFRYFLGC